MEHREAGKKLGLRMHENGEVFLNIEILNEENKNSKIIEFLLDTGFNGYLQLREEDVLSLGLKIPHKSLTKGFDGVTKEIGITQTKIKILDQEITGFPIQVVQGGSALIGTKLLKDLNKMIIIDYRNSYISITAESKVQKKVQKAVDKYAGWGKPTSS